MLTGSRSSAPRDRVAARGRLGPLLVRGAAVGLAAGALVVLATTDRSTWGELRRLDAPAVLAMAALVACAWLATGTRLAVLARGLGHRLSVVRGFRIGLTGELGVVASPGGVGGPAVRLALLHRNGVSLSDGGAMLAADALVDAVFFLLLAPFAVTSLARLDLAERLDLRSRTDLPPGILFGLVVVAVVLLGGLVGWVLLHRHRRSRRSLARLRVRARQALAALRRLPAGALVICLSLAAVQWGCRYGVLPLLLGSFGIEVPFFSLFFLQGLLFLGSLMVALPGGGGSVELGAAVLLALFVPRGLIGVTVVIWRVFTYHLYLLGGAGAALWTAIAARQQR